MVQILLAISLAASIGISSSAQAQISVHTRPATTTVRDVTNEYALILATEEAVLLSRGFPTPTPQPRATPTPFPGAPTPGTQIPGTPPPTDPNLPPLPTDFPPTYPPVTIGGVDLNTIIELGGKIWDFVLSSRPTADYKILKTSIVPAGVTSWTQLRGWSRPISKIYRVTFPNIFGTPGAGSFDYRITFVPGGSYNGKGKFIGALSVAPLNIKLHTDRSLTMRAELSDPLNFGTEDDPVAAAQLIVTWSSPTTTRYQMNSAEYFIYGTGEVTDLTNGN